MGAYNYYASGLPDPATALTDLEFEQQTIIYDRTGKTELARLGELKREVVTFDQLPGEIIDATTAIEDKDFWSNAGIRSGRHRVGRSGTISGRPRGASTITQQLVRARLLPTEAFEGSTYERKIREIIQSVRLTQAYPGETGKQAIITAYLNQNFYGNRSYGVKAAAKGYFGKSMADLTLAQDAILAAIPQSPTKFDLMRNAQEVCDKPVAEGEECTSFKLIVPQDSEIVQRRNKVLELMKSRSPLTGAKHTPAEYDAAMTEPVILQPEVSADWKAPQFVWQVRRQLGEILCPDSPDDCPAVDTGGYRVITTIDLNMQSIVEKWLYVAARGPNSRDPQALLASRKIRGGRPGLDPRAAWPQREQRRGRRHRLPDRAGPCLRRFGELHVQGQSEVPAAVRRPRRRLAAARFVDQAGRLCHRDRQRHPDSLHRADGRHDELRQNFIPIQADKLERGPVRLRSALQFSLNIPAIKATIMTGLNYTFKRTKDFGLQYPDTAAPVLSMGIGTLETHPIDMLGAYGTIANGGVKMPRTFIASIVDDNGNAVWPTTTDPIQGKQVIQPATAYIITDILAGNTDTKINPFWGKWAIYDGKKRRPAAYKTGTTSDNRDVAAYGFLPPPKDPKAPALAVGVWMGNSDNSPNDGKLSLDTSAPLWSAILREVSKGAPIAQFSPPKQIQRATVDVYTGLRPGSFTTKTINEYFVPGTVPTQRETSRMAVTIDAASGLLWRDGCAGPKITRGFVNLNDIDANYPAWQRADAAWAARAASGPGVAGGPKGTRTSYFYTNSFTPFGRTWGLLFAPRSYCPLYVAPPQFCDPFNPPPPGAPACIPVPLPTIQAKPTPKGPTKPTPKPTTFKLKLVTPRPTKGH